MSSDGNDFAFPIHPDVSINNCGLTKREFFASQILAGIVSKTDKIPSSAIKDAVRLADNLINQLNETPPNTSKEKFQLPGT
ncbi:hypothetical protein [Nostoc sp. 'Peltigera membranacea cyanobiont' N6]|uniref:hypothetical protein n=1 Tax=Nostoc sp. 'Peltigera membranacea cyanobiont' N6 TaxID=1261031 RepID=UPI000CF309F3|nr:hypothetical protein [Nostoc sp. 'Peltigera membranacea cyanobiont' N6]AVH68656.1 hypothetical protein NPM_90016 [Nostoc sp. 'Peltigera membranacea cyanobiont' N6]